MPQTPAMTKPFAWGVFLVSLAWFGFVSLTVSRGYYLTGDEVQYISQAERFVHGEIASPRPEIGSFADVRMKETHSYLGFLGEASKYPPGFSAILAMGRMLSLEKFVNPAIASAGIAIFFLLVTPFTGASWAAFGAACLALNPVYWGYAQSYYPHSLTHTLFLLMAWLMLNRDQPPFFRNTLIASLFAILVLTRLPEALFALMIFMACAWHNKHAKDIRVAMFGTAAGLLILLTYIYKLSGKISLSLYGEDDLTLLGLLKGNYSLGSYLTWYVEGLKLRSYELLSRFYVVFSGYLYPLLGLAGLYFTWRAAPRLLFAVGGIALVSLLFYSQLPYMGFPVYGIRYQSYIVVALGLAVVFLFHAMSQKMQRSAMVLALITLAWQGFVALQHYQGYKVRFDYLENNYRQIAEECPDQSIATLPYAYRGYFVNMSPSRFYRDDIPMAGIPAMEKSGKRIHIINLIGNWMNWPPAHKYPICKISVDTNLLRENILRAQDYFLVPYYSDNRSTPPLK